MRINVQRGTGAGRKKPLREKPGPWFCMCPDPTRFATDVWIPENASAPVADVVSFKSNPGYRMNCPDCGARRDGDAES